MTSINVFSHDAILSHLQDCTSRLWDKGGTAYETFRQPWGVQRLKIEETTSYKQWVKFGKVKNVHMYPLLAGEEQSAACEITQYGLIMKPTVPLLRNKQFIIYTNCGVIKPSAQYRTLSYITVQAVGINAVEFTAPRMPTLIINLDFPDQNLIQMGGVHIFYNELFQELQYIDCGQCAADWISLYLNNKSNIRLAYSPMEASDYIKSLRGFMYKKYYGFMGQWTEWLMISLLNCVDNMMISTEVPLSFSNLSEYWSSLSAQPNIVIAADPANNLAQNEWELLRIGTAIIRNPYPRKTKKPRNICDITNRYLVIGFNCVVINTGIVRPDDEVYITRVPDPSLFP